MGPGPDYSRLYPVDQRREVLGSTMFQFENFLLTSVQQVRGFTEVLNSKHEIPALAEAAMRRQGGIKTIF